MKKSLLLAGLALCAVGAAKAENIIDLYECTPARCGGFAQNSATLTAQLMSVQAFPSGKVFLFLYKVKDKHTGELAVGKRLEVYYGLLFNQQSWVTRVGTITVDGYGIYQDYLPFDFRTLTDTGYLSGNFYVNDPSVPNTQFVSGIAAP